MHGIQDEQETGDRCFEITTDSLLETCDLDEGGCCCDTQFVDKGQNGAVWIIPTADVLLIHELLQRRLTHHSAGGIKATILSLHRLVSTEGLVQPFVALLGGGKHGSTKTTVLRSLCGCMCEAARF